MLKAGKLSHLIKEWKQNNGKDQTKTRIARQRITQTFSPESVISFPPLGEEDEMEGPMIIEAKWEDIACTAYMWTEAPPQKFWQISLLVKIGDKEHSTSAWMNFMVVRSPSPYNGIIGRPGVRKIRAIPSTA
ncbi:hypothetical protein Tco_0235035, partial [Tanacetum coccineum]